MLQPGEGADRADRRAADLAGSFRDVVRHRENLRALLVKEEVVVPEILAWNVPMAILGRDVKREHVCQKRSEGGRDILRGVGAEIAWRVGRRLAVLLSFFHTHF